MDKLNHNGTVVETTAETNEPQKNTNSSQDDGLKRESPIKAPDTIQSPKDLLTTIKAKHQDNKEELAKLKGVSDSSKKVIEMIEKRPPDVQGLITHAGDVLAYVFELFLSGDGKGENGVISEILGYDFDMSQIKSEEVAQRWIDDLTTAINNGGSDVIERFITLHAKSKIIDKQFDLKYQKEGKDATKLTKKERLLQTVRPGDIVLIDYRNTKNIEAEMTNKALKSLSKSAFCHVGFVGNNQTLYHSTLAKQDGGSGVERRGFADYLDAKGDCLVMVIRPQNLSETQRQEMISKAENHVSNRAGYDTKAAISNLSGGSIKGDKNTYNCGEYVYDVLSTVYPKISIKNSALPQSYAEQKNLEWHYLTKVTTP